MNDGDLDDVLTALGDPTRRALLRQLAGGPARVTDLARPFVMSLAAVSKHIKVLEQAGLVTRTRAGRTHQIALDAGPLREVARWAGQFERFWNNRLDRLEAHFAAHKESDR
ncbi:MAG: metalloregulator ArsR/SmtB family transcription factor [Kofleriaceae bacterium]